MIDITPDPVAFMIGSIPIYWYGICYAVGLAAVYFVLVNEAKFRGEDPEIVGNALIIVAVAALIGGRLYHVIDQSQVYAADPIRAVLPVVRQPDGSYAFSGFAGLGVPGGIIVGTITAWFLTRRWKLSFWTWADIVAPALFVMQAIGRIGNFFNQELYGPPTDLPWGIAIDCVHRVAEYPCSEYPLLTTHFHPLFLYESLSGLLGFLTLIWLARHARRLVPGDLLGIFFIWYGTTRFVLEFFRSGNWTFFGIPMAQIVTLGFIVFGVAVIWYRHGRGRPSEAELAAAAEHQPEAPDSERGEGEFGADYDYDQPFLTIDDPEDPAAGQSEPGRTKTSDTPPA
jgi:phosphatidylglycerol:prolipoprotein diacylglycerol transferase